VKSLLVDPAYVKKLIEIATCPMKLCRSPNRRRSMTGLKQDRWLRCRDRQRFRSRNDRFGPDRHRLRKAKFLAVNAQIPIAPTAASIWSRHTRAPILSASTSRRPSLATMERYAPIETVVRDKLGEAHRLPHLHRHAWQARQHRLHAERRREAHSGVDRTRRSTRSGRATAFFALAAPLVAKGSDPFLAAFIGNAVGAMKVRIVGQRHQITKPEI